MADIVDLRKKKQIIEAEHSVLLDPRKKELILRWSGGEYERRQRSTSWFVATGGIAGLLVIFGILSKSYFFILFVALAYVVFMMYERKMPAQFDFSISAEGVAVGNKLHKFSELKSFWIMLVEGSMELSLETEKTLLPYIKLPLKNIDPERVRSFLRNYLPEKEHDDFLTDKIERNF